MHSIAHRHLVNNTLDASPSGRSCYTRVPLASLRSVLCQARAYQRSDDIEPRNQLPASTSSPAAPQSLRNIKSARKLKSRLSKQDRTIWRLERKLHRHAPDSSKDEQILLERLLHVSLERRDKLENQDLSKADVAAQRLLLHCKELDVDPALLAQLAEGNLQLLLLQPLELRARVELLVSALSLNSPTELLELSLQHPTLITRPSYDLAKSLPNLAALFKSRGMDMRAMARMQPDLLLQNPGTIRHKLDAIPAALDLPPRRAREVVSMCPQLLRRSTASVHERYKLLQKLFDSVPRNFLNELVCSDPRVLCISAKTMAAKFSRLMSKYGSFQADVVDMILVDPNILLRVQMQPQQASAAPLPVQRQPKAVVSGSARLVALASELQVPLVELLLLCTSPGSDVCRWQVADAATAVAALGAALCLPLDEAKALVRKQVRLLGVPAEELQQRAAKLQGLLRLPVNSGAAAAASAASDASVAVAPARLPRLLLLNPDLLLSDPVELDGRIEQLAQLMNLPLDRMQAMLEASPTLIMEPAQQVVERLLAIRNLLGGVSAGLVSELVVKEPRILSTPLADLVSAFDELASSFGSFREDALQLILADPSMLLGGRAATAGFATMDRGEELQKKGAGGRKKKSRQEAAALAAAAAAEGGRSAAAAPGVGQGKEEAYELDGGRRDMERLWT